MGIYLLCFLVRMVEYLLIRTDRTVIGEAFIHKVIGIIILFAVLRRLGYRWSEIGFQRQTALRHTCRGLLLGAATFFVAYTTEWVILAMGGRSPELRFYISSYSITGNHMMQTSILFFLVCIAGNIINVVMEEGLFRGLFLKLYGDKTSFAKAALFSCLLFGIWHTSAPLREFFDGSMTLGTMLAASLVEVILTGVMGILLCLLVKISGSLWMAMAVHFVNNFIVNVLHVITTSGADELQVVRISIAQTLSFLIVLYILWRKRS